MQRTQLRGRETPEKYNRKRKVINKNQDNRKEKKKAKTYKKKKLRKR
jgi:hypothetical protein